MIPHFEEVKRQLADLAPIINSFNAEAVQLRIVELILSGARAEHLPQTPQPGSTTRRERPRRRATARQAGETNGGGKVGAPARPTAKSGRQSAVATIGRLIEEGFFKKGKTLAEMVAHCETKLALHYKQSNFSGPLIRLVRDNRLTREKNAEGQYVYQEV